MSLDLRFCSSKSCVLPRSIEETNNKFLEVDFIDFSCFKDSFEAIDFIKENCDLFQEDIGTKDFHFNNYIFLWDHFMNLKFENETIQFIQNFFNMSLEKGNFIFFEEI